MDYPSAFKISGSRAIYRLKGSVSTGELADLITSTLELSRAKSLREVVINIAEMTGFESPGPAYRRWVVRRWSKAVGNKLRVAMVAREEHICPEKTGLLVAAEEGLEANIFTLEADAVAWIDAFKPAKKGKRHASKSAWAPHRSGPWHPWL